MDAIYDEGCMQWDWDNEGLFEIEIIKTINCFAYARNYLLECLL